MRGRQATCIDCGEAVIPLGAAFEGGPGEALCTECAEGRGIIEEVHWCTSVLDLEPPITPDPSGSVRSGEAVSD